MAGKVGRSGRRSLSDEVVRAAVRQLAWETTGAYMKSNGSFLERAKIAVGVVKSDMAKPIVIDNSTHTHVTLDLSKLTKEQKTELALGRRSVKDFQHTG